VDIYMVADLTLRSCGRRADHVYITGCQYDRNICHFSLEKTHPQTTRFILYSIYSIVDQMKKGNRRMHQAINYLDITNKI
jgi:hypothetical protein